MFAEDVGLIPREYFTTLLYEGMRAGDVEKRLGTLFDLMSKRDAPAPRAVPFFNGGLFTKPVALPLGAGQLKALTKAAEADWKYVDPHIFGSVFQGIMNDAERHKSGAHYTAHDDIMRVVGPTIVKPWRQRIDEAKSLAELLALRAALHQFRVLDPACGSGNFLYVAFRELYRLDTGLLARVREFPSTQGHGKKVTWGAAIPTSNFFGIDINPFAVALAKVTLNIAKKIAFDERRDIALDLGGQLDLEVDPSLPLDNLDQNIICADALFTEWPDVDAIVGNPPILGGIKVREELGPKYLERLQRAFPTVNGRADYCVYWFRRAHDHLLSGRRAGLVGTSGIRVGWSREAALDYVATREGTITNAVSSRVWPGEAALNVSMVNWVKGRAIGPFELIVEDEVYRLPHIATHLQLHCDVSEAHPIAANTKGTTRGVMFGHDAFRSESVGFPAFERGQRAIRPLATGDDLLRGRLGVKPELCIWLSDCDTELAAKKRDGRAFAHLKENLYPWLKNRADGAKETKHYTTWIRRWWQPHYKREDFFAAASGLRRWIACSRVGSRPIFAFLSTAFVPNDTIQLFGFDDDYSFGVIQSSLHWAWTKAKGGKVTERITYSTDAWTTFPWPQEPNAEEVAAVASAARGLRGVRDELMKANGWSLRALYQAADVPGPHPLKEAQAALDDAVRAAYGMPADVGVADFLLELNRLVAEDENAERKVQGPGVPQGLDPRDPRWRSDDCIEPPAQEGGRDG
jgi:SAM-dependent methyltransferase